MTLDRSRWREVLVVVRRGAGPLHAQLEEALRAGAREGRLPAGTILPGSRALAEELGVSRSVVTEAYGQLAAEGWIQAGDRRAPRIAPAPTPTAPPRTRTGSTSAGPDDGKAARPAGGGHENAQGRRADPPSHTRPAPTPAGIRYDLRPGAPDLALFPRAEWARSVRHALATAPDAALGYPPPDGATELRLALAAYLGRVRGIVPTGPDGPLVCAGTTGGLALALATLRATGRRRVAVEDPGHAGVRAVVEEAGCTVTGVPVDDEGLVVDALPSDAGAVLVTPAHQFPTGVVLSPARRAALLRWAAAHDAYVLEDDYDAEFRYDRTPVGALQGLGPDRVASMGSASKTLAPGLRLGWLTLPPALRRPAEAARPLADMGRFAVDQLAFADLLGRGAYDRHLRRARRLYRDRRDRLAALLEGAGTVGGIAAGLHLTLTLGGDERALAAAAAADGVAVEPIGPHRIAATDPATATLLVGYGRVPTAAIERAGRALTDAIGP